MADIANLLAQQNFGGLDLARIDALRRQNALGNLDFLKEANRQSILNNPNATPEQMIRGGAAPEAQALMQQQAYTQQQKATAAAVLGQRFQAISMAPDNLVLPLTNAFLNSQEFQKGAPLIGLNPADYSLTPQDTPQSLKQQAAAHAQFLGVKPDEYTMGKDQVRFRNDQQVSAGPGDSDVTWHDTGAQLVPLLKNGQPAPGVEPINKQTPPAQQFTNDSVENTAQMIYRGQMPMLSGFVLKSQFGQDVLKRVGDLSKQGEVGGGDAFNAGTFQQKAKALRDFSTGQQGNSVRFMNVAISHINTLEDLGQQLDNGDVQAFNKLKNAWKTQTGQSIPTSFNAARDIVANEVVKAVTASGGGVADREEAQSQISQASSWAQIANVAQTWKQLLAGQLGGLRLQYEQSTGLKDFNKKLYPETLLELGGADNSQPAAGGWTIKQVNP